MGPFWGGVRDRGWIGVKRKGGKVQLLYGGPRCHLGINFSVLVVHIFITVDGHARSLLIAHCSLLIARYESLRMFARNLAGPGMTTREGR